MLTAESASRQQALSNWIPLSVLLALCVLLSVFLMSRYAPVFVSNDGAQYISTAKHIFQGKGVKTDILYFDTHFLSGETPTAQTIWPPGFPALIATTSLATGLTMHESAFTLGVLALIGVGLIVYAILRNAGGSRAAALLCACLSLGFAHAWVDPLVVSTEPVFVFLTIASLYFVGSHERDPHATGHWVLAGVLAAGAFLVRYAGVFYVAAVGLWLVKDWLSGSRHISWRHVAAFSTPPMTAIAGVFAWNYAMVGSITSRSGADAGFSLLETVWEFRIPISDIMGFLPDGMFANRAAYLGLGVFVLACGFCAYRLRAHWPAVAIELRSRAMAQISLIYMGVTIAYMFYLTWGTAPGHVVPRYLATLFPFALVAIFLIAHKLPPIESRVTQAAAVLVVLMFVAGQINNAARLTTLQQEGAQLAFDLDRPYGQRQTLREYLSEMSTHGPIFANETQLLGYYLNGPTLGPAGAPFTSQRFDAARVQQIVDEYAVALVVLFPDPPLAGPAASSDKAEIFQDLAAGRVPGWLTEEYADDFVQIYRPNR